MSETPKEKETLLKIKGHKVKNKENTGAYLVFSQDSENVIHKILVVS